MIEIKYLSENVDHPMQISVYFKMVCVCFILLVGAGISENDLQATAENVKSIEAESKNNEEYFKNSKALCPICYENIPFFPDEELDRQFCFKNSLFQCETDRQSYHLKCLIPWFNRQVENVFIENKVTCPSCRKDLNESFSKYRNEFIEYLLENPQKEFINTLETILNEYDHAELIKQLFIANKIESSSLEILLEMLKPIGNQGVQNFKNSLVKILVILEKEIVSRQEVEIFCSVLKAKSKKVPEFLSKNLDYLQLFTTKQKLYILSFLLNLDFSSTNSESEAIFYFYDTFFNDKLLITLSQEDRMELSLLSLNETTVKGLEIFIKLNQAPAEYSQESYRKISELLYSLFIVFEYDEVYFQAIKSFIQNIIIDQELRAQYFFLYAPEELMLECDYEFLLRYFDESFIFAIFPKYLGKESSSSRAIQYYFENIIEKSSWNSFSIICRFISDLNVSAASAVKEEDLKAMENFLISINNSKEYFSRFIKAYELYKERNGHETNFWSKFFKVYNKFNISQTLLKNFETMIEIGRGFLFHSLDQIMTRLNGLQQEFSRRNESEIFQRFDIR